MGTIQTLKDTGSSNQITSSMDGAVYRLSTLDCVLEGIGDEFALSYTSSSLQVSFNAGSECVICGNFFKVMQNTTVTLPASSSGYLCARIDTSQQAGSTGSFQFLTTAQIQNGNINGADSVCDLKLYQIQTNTTGVSSATSVKVVGSKPGTQVTYSLSGTTLSINTVQVR